MAVWARSYDEADRRIQEDARVGLPDDYRRFCIHGEKLLKNLTRFEKRYPKLAVAKSQLEQRLGRIQGQIDDLSHTIQKNILDGSGEEYPASVFDRVSSSSQSDAATMQSHGSQLSRMGSLDGEVDLVQSPVTELWERDTQLVPYPTTPGVMPTLPEFTEDDDQETVVLSVAGTQVHVGATDPVDTSSLPPDPYDRQQDSAAYFDEWQNSIPHHRVLKRQETRRYHDRAGSWRSMSVTDPRVGLSWEVALGSISSRRDSSQSPSGAHITAQSEAEMQLNKIKKAAPPSPRQRGSFGSQSMARPMTLVGRNSWAIPQAQKTSDAEVAQIPPEEFSSGLTQILSSPKSWTEATIKMLKKAVIPSDKVKSSPQPQKPQTPPEEELIVPPSGIFRGSRSANSSPASHSSPFPPPSFSGMPTDELFSQAGVPVVVRRWDTVVYHPDGTPISSSGIEWSSASDPLSHSFPTLPPSRPHHPGNINTAQLLLHGSSGGPPAGYSSQPMSRDGSHQSNPSINIHSPTAGVQPTRSRSRSPSPSPTGTDPAQRASPPRHATSATGSGPTGSQPIPTPSSRLAPFPFARGRPPSYTETEPSPRMDTPFDVDTSYRHYTDQHNHHPDHHSPPTTTGTSFPPPTSSTIPNPNNHNSRTRLTSLSRLRPGRRATRILPTRGAAAARRAQQQQPRDIRGRRAHSLSPSGGSGSVSPVPWPASPSSSSPLSYSPLSSSPRGRAMAQARDVAGAGTGLGLGVGMGVGAGGYSFPQPQTQQQQGQQGQQHLSPLAEWAAPGETGAVLGEVVPMPMGGEDMARSASAGSGNGGRRSRSGSGATGGGGVAAAGIRMEDGTVVEFGSPALGGSPSGSSPGLGSPGSGRGAGGKPRRGSFPGMGTNGFVVFD